MAKRWLLRAGLPAKPAGSKFWNWPAREKMGSYRVHADVIYQIAWTKDSQKIFTAGHDGEVLEIRVQSGKIERRFSGHSQPIRALCLLEEQQTLVSAGNDQTIRVWNIDTGELVRSLNNHTKPILGMAVRPQTGKGKLPILASLGADGTVRLWQPTIGRMMRFLRLPAFSALALAWSPDGQRLLITRTGGELQSIDPDTLEILSTEKTEITRPISLLIPQAGNRAVFGGTAGRIQILKWKAP